MILQDFIQLKKMFCFLGFKNLQDIANFKSDVVYNNKLDFFTNLQNYYKTLKDTKIIK